MIKKIRLVGFILLFISYSIVHAEDNSTISDRPGFSTGTDIMKVLWVNISSGYQYSFSNSGTNNTTQTLPLLNFRFGLVDKLELNILWNGWSIQGGNYQTLNSSLSDLSIGLKHRFYESQAYNLGVLALVSLPVGNNTSTSNNIDPTLAFLWDYSLSKGVSLFGMVQGDSSKLNDKRIYNIQPALGTSFSFNKASFFVEVYSLISSESEIKTQAVFDGGISYLFGRDTKIDMNFGIGLNKASDNFFGVGFVKQFSF